MTVEFHEAANIFPLDEEHLDDLAADIREHGLQVPIETLDGKIIDGRRRHLACLKAGAKAKYRPVGPLADPIAYVLSMNLHRRQLSESQRAMVGQRARELYANEAKKRMQEAGSRGGKSSGATRRGETKGLVNLPDPSAGNARDQAGKAVGVSGKSIDFARTVINSENEPLIAAVDSDAIAVSTAAKMTDATPEEVAKVIANSKGRAHIRKNEVTDSQPEGESNGSVKSVGIIRANEAINCLSRIPKNDRNRKRGFQIVKDWIRRNP
jgi:general stress protein YciG